MANFQVTNVQTGIEQLTDRNFYVTWDPPIGKKDDTKEYQVQWAYWLNNDWVKNSIETVPKTVMRSAFSLPSNSFKAKVRVKPIPEETGSGKKKKDKYTSEWTSWLPRNGITPAKAVGYTIETNRPTVTNKSSLTIEWGGFILGGLTGVSRISAASTAAVSALADKVLATILEHIKVVSYSYSYLYYDGTSWGNEESGTVLTYGEDLSRLIVHPTNIPENSYQAQFSIAPVFTMDSGYDTYSQYVTAEPVSIIIDIAWKFREISDKQIFKKLLKNGNREVVYTWTSKKIALEGVTGFEFEYRYKQGNAWSTSSPESVSIDSAYVYKTEDKSLVKKGTGYDEDAISVGNKDYIYAKNNAVYIVWGWDIVITLPAGVTAVEGRVRCKAEGGETAVIDTWSTWVGFSYDPPSKALSDVTIKAESIGNYYATWNANPDNNHSDNIASYEYIWRYTKSRNNTSGWITGTSGNVSAADPTWYQTPNYSPPSGTKFIEFRVKPIPKNENDFTACDIVPIVSSLDSLLPSREITNLTHYISDLANREVVLDWSDITDDGTLSEASGYSVVYKYVRTFTDFSGVERSVEFTESPKTVNSSSDTWNWPEGTSKVTYMVTGIATDEDWYGKTIPGEFSLSTEPRYVSNLGFTPLANQDRVIRYTWKFTNDLGHLSKTEAYTWYTEYKKEGYDGVFPGEGPTNTNYPVVDLTVPSDAIGVNFYVKPNDDYNGNAFEGRYTKPVTHTFTILNRTVGKKRITVELQNGSSTRVVAVWDPDNTDNVASYEYEWMYYADPGIWYADKTTGSASIDGYAVTYDAPEVAFKVRFRIKPVPEFSTSFKGIFSDWVECIIPAQTIPEKPSPPNVTINRYNLVAKIDTYDTKALRMEFEVVSEEEQENVGSSDIIFNRATFQSTVVTGKIYRVRCRGVNDQGNAGDWSEWSSEVSSPPAAIDGEIRVIALSDTTVEVTWESVEGANNYTIEWAEKARYFDAAPDQVQSQTYENTLRAEITVRSSDDPGKEFYFRIKVTNDSGDSEWSPIVSCLVGTVPSAPTTWNSTTTATVDRDVYLYWLHNSVDNSLESEAELELNVNGVIELHRLTDEGDYLVTNVTLSTSETVYTDEAGSISIDITDIPVEARSTIAVTRQFNDGDIVDVPSTDYVIEGDTLTWSYPAGTGAYEYICTLRVSAENKELVHNPDEEYYSISSDASYYYLPAGTYEAGANISWRVRTKGVLPDYGPWSVQRIVKIYTPPVVNMTLAHTVGNGWEWDSFDFTADTIYTAAGERSPLLNNTLTEFPLLVYLDAYPASQTPISYVISITANEAYETNDENGMARVIRAGQEVFSKYYSTDTHTFMTAISAGDVDFEQDVTYTIKAVVAMNSGLTAEATARLAIEWNYTETFDIRANVVYDEQSYAAYIMPVCLSESGVLLNDVMLAVFRREADGQFKRIADRITNSDLVAVTDPHPTLDYARYRIVARSRRTGKMDYYDVPAVPVNEPAIILQWNEQWQEFYNADELPEDNDIPIKRGSILRLPYNVDVTDNNTVDSELIEYIGRSHPVSYYGTQVGQTSTWNTDVPKYDKETIYALRRLAVWMGDVYVREPSGTGYWAGVKVSFDLKHTEVVVPVTLDITRVEGGL